jgi:hypothetical protein
MLISMISFIKAARHAAHPLGQGDVLEVRSE